MSFVVAITSSDGKRREVPLPDGETTIGRDPSNTLVLDGRGVSRWHAKFVVNATQLSIIDLGSTYGTRVNDVPAMRRDLAVNDQLIIGMHRLQVRPTSEPFDRGDSHDTHENGPSQFFSDDVTLDPHERQTLQIDESTIQFILDSPDESGQLKVLKNEKSDLMRAVEELESGKATISQQLNRTPTTSEWQDPIYHALVLMYKVSARLAAATDLDSFVAPVADLVIDAVNANTVLVLLLNSEGELVPRVIRHRGALNPGEVPVSRGILDLVISELEPVISNDVGHDERIESGQSLALFNIRSVVAAPLLLHGQLKGVLYLHRSGPKAFSKADGDLVGALSSLLASGIEQSALKERVVDENLRRKAIERFHPPEIAERLALGDQVGALEEHPATVVVCDIQGFGELARNITPRELARILHEYYETLYDKIFANGGSLVKLHEGWALALFGAPAATNRDAVWAVEAALALCTEFASLAMLWRPDVGTLGLRCALDTGPVVAGFVGAVDRLEYAALGAPIGVTSAVAQAAEGTSLMVTERTWKVLPHKRYRVKPVELLPDQKIFQLSRATPSGS